MDHQAFAQLLGNYGEFVGAIAVVVTLGYLAIQVRHSREAVNANTKSLEENRRLALAQVYQSRANQVQNMALLRAESDHWPDLRIKAESNGFGALSQIEQVRWTQFQRAESTQLDNIHYQYELGFLDDDFHENTFKPLIKSIGPSLIEADALYGRRTSFVRDVEKPLETELSRY